MSRVGKKQIILSSGVNCKFDEQTRLLSVTGKLGTLTLVIPDNVNLNITPESVNVEIENQRDKYQKSIWGTVRALINNMVVGVTESFNKEIELNGVGYRMELGSELTLYIGFSHPVKIVIPSQIKLTLEKNKLKGSSIDKQLLGNFFSNLHNMKPCDVYKQKGFKFPNRFYRTKIGKRGK